MTDTPIPYHRPHLTERELTYMREALEVGHFSGDGAFTRRCHAWLEQQTRASKALLTHSCTAALEMSALLLEIQPGDEIVMPSFTFVSTANAFVLRGGIPVFVDIRADTLNLDEALVEAAITPRTRAIVPVHYAGVSCEMDALMAIAARHGLAIVEDAAQGLMASYKGRPLGSMGAFGTLSFHETKNLISGEGGALLVNDPAAVHRAEIVREKGTDRSAFLRGQVDKYTWRDVGSSFLPSEMQAAFLMAQLEDAAAITKGRVAAWNTYHGLLEPLERRGALRRPAVPADCEHNGHLYYVLMPSPERRQAVLDGLRQVGVGAAFHYVPLHSSPAGKRYCRAQGDLPVTVSSAARLVRLPLWSGITEQAQRRAIDVLQALCVP